MNIIDVLTIENVGKMYIDNKGAVWTVDNQFGTLNLLMGQKGSARLPIQMTMNFYDVLHLKFRLLSDKGVK